MNSSDDKSKKKNKDQDGDTSNKSPNIPFDPKKYLRRLIEGEEKPKKNDYTSDDKD